MPTPAPITGTAGSVSNKGIAVGARTKYYSSGFNFNKRGTKNLIGELGA